MNHTSPPSSGRRLRRPATIVGGVIAGATAAVLFATPALACAPTVRGEAACDKATGEWIITWKVANDINRPATITAVTATPEVTLTNIVVGAELPVPGRPPLTDVVRVPAEKVEGLKEATLTVTGHWPAQGRQRAETVTRTGKATFVGTCVKPSPSPVPSSAAPSAPASSPAAPAPSTSPAPGAGGSLPVTGSSVAIHQRRLSGGV